MFYLLVGCLSQPALSRQIWTRAAISLRECNHPTFSSIIAHFHAGCNRFESFHNSILEVAKKNWNATQLNNVHVSCARCKNQNALTYATHLTMVPYFASTWNLSSPFNKPWRTGHIIYPSNDFPMPVQRTELVEKNNHFSPALRWIIV